MIESGLATFIQTQFPSVWTLEVLLFLRTRAERSWSPEQLVADLRASDAIIASALRCLETGGLIIIEQDGAARYSTASIALDGQVADIEKLYKSKLGAVRALIINPSSAALSAFSDSFNLRRDP